MDVSAVREPVTMPSECTPTGDEKSPLLVIHCRAKERCKGNPSGFRRLEDSLAASIGPRRFNTILIGSFELGALLMAVAGTFGVVARTVTRRTREVGVR